MMQESPIKTYVISKKWRIVAVVAGIVFIAYGAVLISLPYWRNKSDDEFTKTILKMLGSACIGFYLRLMADAFKYRLEIFPDKIRRINSLRVKDVMFEDIYGYRGQFGGTNWFFHLFSEKLKRKLTIPMMLDNSSEFKQWLVANFKDISSIKSRSEVESEKELSQALKDERLGSNEEQRKANLKRIKRWGGNSGLFLGFAGIYWGVFHPKPYELCIWVLVLFPFLAVSLVLLFPAIFKLEAKSRGRYFPVGPLMAIPMLCLSLRSFVDWTIFDWKPFWGPFTLLTLVPFGILLALFREVRQKKMMMGHWMVYCAIYGYGVCICLNGILDRNPPAQFQSKVMDKRMDTGRPPEYFMTLSPWGTVLDQREFKVYGSVYQHRAINDAVTVYLKKGAFHIPYYYIY